MTATNMCSNFGSKWCSPAYMGTVDNCNKIWYVLICSVNIIFLIYRTRSGGCLQQIKTTTITENNWKQIFKCFGTFSSANAKAHVSTIISNIQPYWINWLKKENQILFMYITTS